MALLNDVVEHDQALNAFRGGETIERAHRLTGAGASALLDALSEVAEALASALNQANQLDRPPNGEHRVALGLIHERVAQLSDVLDSAEAPAQVANDSAGSAEG
jgi:HPt (histidine-containing phosphotransfer) domain-containing protein